MGKEVSLIIPNYKTFELTKLCMEYLENTYPQYGFAKHKGYGTAEHIDAIFTHGMSDVHRRSFCTKLKRREASDIRFFSKEERKLIVDEATRKFSNGAPAYRLGWAYVLLLYSGLRVGELCALTWDDIDFTEKTITVHKNAVEYSERDENGKTRSVYKTQNSTKTRSGMRIVPMTEKAFIALSELQKITGEYEHIITSSQAIGLEILLFISTCNRHCG